MLKSSKIRLKLGLHGELVQICYMSWKSVYSRIRFNIGLLALILNSILGISQDSLIVSGQTNLSGVNTYPYVEISSLGLLVLDGELNTTKLIIRDGGSLTHNPRFEAGLILNISDSLVLESGAKIDVNGKGLRGGNNGSIFGPIAEAYNDNGNIIEGSLSGSNGVSGNGGSYGGDAALNGTGTGTTNNVYGVIEDPAWLGSGGMGGRTEAPGGSGGGKIKLTAGILILDGCLSANGDSGGRVGFVTGGGGSGGSINIVCSAISGNGVIQANGGGGKVGNSTLISGGGSGGRIAINYQNFNFPIDSIKCFGEFTNHDNLGANTTGAAGTIYLKGGSLSQGVLLVNGDTHGTNYFTQLKSNLTNLDSILVSNGARCAFTTLSASPLNTLNYIKVLNASTLRIDFGFTLTPLIQTGMIY